MSTKILVADDEPALVRLMDKVLSKNGYEVFHAGDGREALRLMYAHQPDLVILDVVMPGMDGWQTCRRIREVSDIPIVIMTGNQTSEGAIVRGLEYIGNRELVARVKAILRRTGASSGGRPETDYADRHVKFDFYRRRLTVENRHIKLTPIEFRLLAYLVANAGRALTYRQLLEKVWGWEYIDELDYVRIYIRNLRKKLEPDPARPRYILTEPGFGYRFQKAE